MNVHPKHPEQCCNFKLARPVNCGLIHQHPHLITFVMFIVVHSPRRFPDGLRGATTTPLTQTRYYQCYGIRTFDFVLSQSEDHKEGRKNNGHHPQALSRLHQPICESLLIRYKFNLCKAYLQFYLLVSCIQNVFLKIISNQLLPHVDCWS